ncbi:Phosducin protein 3 [Phytophthora cinnamomi]|uniref:Phosducin protein 3 n=1 Tax=Phytophthora cinnamomi TaxID=4785 RepID=UPI00355ABBEC|nr:Phosducin protein 3 [Phytophthora cinnamomi]
MLDPTTVGANLTPAQQEETVADLAFFLDEFGSTRAVCAKLQEQERDIQQLQQQVWRLLGRRSDRNAQQQHETAANYSKMGVDVIKNWEKDPELVDDIMESVDFFLRAYGSTRAVRNRLQSQSHLIAGLKCTVNWFLQLHKNGGTPSLSTEAAPKFVGVRLPSAVKAAQENEEPTRTQQLDADEGNNVTSNSSKDGAEVIRIAGGRGANDKRDGGSLQSAASMSLVSAKFLNSAAVTDYVKALKCVDEACAKATSSKFKNPSDAAGSFRQINEIEPISKENASSANNVRAVGSDLTPAQKDEVMTDLAFFLDEFGSTRAVCVKLQEQESEIERLRRLLSQETQQDTDTQKRTLSSSEEAVEDVDDIMADLSYFLGTFGSTRAVRERLENQKQEIAALQRATQWVLDARQIQNKSDESRGAVRESAEPASVHSLSVNERRLDNGQVTQEKATDERS